MNENKVEKEKKAAYKQGYQDGYNNKRMYETSDSYIQGFQDGRRKAHMLNLITSSWPSCTDPNCAKYQEPASRNCAKCLGRG